MKILTLLLALAALTTPVQAGLVDGYNNQTRGEELTHSSCLETHSRAQFRQGERSNLVRYTVTGNQVQATKVYFGGNCEFLGSPLLMNSEVTTTDSTYVIRVEGAELVRYIRFNDSSTDNRIRRGVWGTRF